MRVGRVGGARGPAVALALLAIALAALGWWPAGRSTPWPALLLWSLAFAAYVGAARGAGRLPRAVVWGGGLGLRLLFLPLPPHFSEDLYRYLWDGWVQRAGIDPFRFAPAEEGVEALRTAWWGFINHPEIPTIYPPGAQVVFLLLATVASSWLLYKVAWVAADLGVAALVGRVARRRGAADDGTRALALYLWSPLLLVEVAWSGHLEPLGLLPMMGAVAVLGAAGTGRAPVGEPAPPAVPGSRRRRWLGGGLLGLGIAVKFAPIAAVPAVWRRHGARAAAAALLVPALLYVPYASAGPRLFEGLATYAERWAFNGGLFPLLETVLGSGDLARLAAASAVVAVALLAARRAWSVARALLWTIGAALLLSPTLHPWYVLWVLPLACVFQSRAWLALSGTVFLAYAGRDAYLATGAWPHPPALAAAIHLPVLVLLAFDLRGAQSLPGGQEVSGREQGGEGDGGRGPDDQEVGDGPEQ